MYKKICFLVSAFALLSLLGQQAQADFYKGYEGIGGAISGEIPTKGSSPEGIRQTLLSQILTGSEGEDLTLTVTDDKVIKYPNYGTGHDRLEEDRVFHLAVKHIAAKRNTTDPVDLVMVIPGFGADLKSGAAKYLSDLLNKNGYLTITSHSPAYSQFIYDSSTYGAPGSQTQDAKDLYFQLQQAIEHLKKQYTIGNISVIGASLGSMNAAAIGKIDRVKQKRKEKDAIGLYRVFSLNPPISNVYGSTAIDTFVAKTVGHDKMDFSKRLQAYRAGIRIKLKQFFTSDYDEVTSKSQEALASLTNLANDADELKFLVGFGFAPTVDEAIDPMHKRWADDFVSTRFSDRNFMVVDFFTQFLRQFSVPYSYHEGGGKLPPRPKRKYSFLNDKCETGTREEISKCQSFIITENESLGVIIPDMQKARYDLSYFHLVTWDDDFLLRVPVAGQEAAFKAAYSQNDAEWIRTTLGGGTKGNSKVFTNGGGHLGGYYQPEFQKYLLDNLK